MDCFKYQIDDKELIIYRFVCSYLASNMFAILSGDEAIVIDPCEDIELIDLLKEKEISKVHILLTHEHYDHISGVEWLLVETSADIYCQRDAANNLAIGRTRTPALISTVLANEDRKDGGHRYPDFKKKFKPYRIIADKTFEKEDHFKIGNLSFMAISTPGHSLGSSCYIVNGHFLFSGDTLLQYNPVIIRFSNSSKQLYDDITLPFLRKLDKTMIVIPGHGSPFILCETKNI